MDSNTNSQTKARVIVVSVFVIGFVAGALALNLYQRLTSSSNGSARAARAVPCCASATVSVSRSQGPTYPAAGYRGSRRSLGSKNQRSEGRSLRTSS